LAVGEEALNRANQLSSEVNYPDSRFERPSGLDL